MTCAACEGSHPIQKCPAIRALLFADDPLDPGPEDSTGLGDRSEEGDYARMEQLTAARAHVQATLARWQDEATASGIPI